MKTYNQIVEEIVEAAVKKMEDTENMTQDEIDKKYGSFDAQQNLKKKIQILNIRRTGGGPNRIVAQDYTKA